MKIDEITAIYEKHNKKVRVNCDEYHHHSAQMDCLDGPSESIEICKLYEEILRYRARIGWLYKELIEE